MAAIRVHAGGGRFDDRLADTPKPPAAAGRSCASIPGYRTFDAATSQSAAEHALALNASSWSHLAPENEPVTCCQRLLHPILMLASTPLREGWGARRAQHENSCLSPQVSGRMHSPHLTSWTMEERFRVQGLGTKPGWLKAPAPVSCQPGACPQPTITRQAFIGCQAQLQAKPVSQAFEMDLIPAAHLVS